MKNLDGEWSEPENQVLVPATDEPEPYFKFGKKDKNLLIARKNPWRVVPDDKSQPAHRMAGTQDTLDRIYEHAISVGTPIGTGKGWGWVGVASGLLMAAIGTIYLFQTLDDNYFYEKFYGNIFDIATGSLILLISALLIIFY